MANQTASTSLALFALASLLVTPGCSSLRHCEPPPPGPKADDADMSHHVIELNSEGFLVDLRPHHKGSAITEREALQSYLQTNIFDRFQQGPQKKMMLFVHGGMNDRKQGLDHFRTDYQEVLRGEYYPVFVVWPSGWKATYVEHLLWVRQGLKAETVNEKAFSLLTSPLTLLADVGRSLTRLPLVVANNSKSDFEMVTPIRSREGGAAVQQYRQLVKEGCAVAIGDDYSLASNRAMRDVTYWATLPLKYVVASWIDGFGKGAWDNMLRRTEQVYPAKFDPGTLEWMKTLQRTNNMSAQNAAEAVPAKHPMTKRQKNRQRRYAAAGLPVFLDMLHSYQTNSPNLEVALVGHSMGAIILNRLVRDAEMEFANIIYLGAACSIQDFSRSVLPYMRNHPVTQFYNLSLHPVAEAGEWYIWLADLPPRGSLLVWIDNFLSNPVTEQERTLGRWRNLFRSGSTGEPILRRFFASDGGDLKERLHFQAFSVGSGDKEQVRKIKYQWNDHPRLKDERDRCDNPLSHGELSEVPYWKSSFWWQSGNEPGEGR